MASSQQCHEFFDKHVFSRARAREKEKRGVEPLHQLCVHLIRSMGKDCIDVQSGLSLHSRALEQLPQTLVDRYGLAFGFLYELPSALFSEYMSWVMHQQTRNVAAEVEERSWRANKAGYMDIFAHDSITVSVCFSGNLVNYFAREIVRHKRLSDRVRTMTTIAAIGHCAVTHDRNYQLGMMCRAALEHSAVHRLKHTRAQLSDESKLQIDEFTSVCTSAKSYQALRRCMIAECKSERFHVPYLGMYLTDATFIFEGNPSDERREQELQKLFDSSLKPAAECVFTPELTNDEEALRAIDRYLVNQLHPDRNFSEETLYAQSPAREPRGATIDSLIL
jgi:RasGEF domain